MNPKRIGILGFDGVMALDVVGPADAFTSAFVEDERGRARPGYEVLIVGQTAKPFGAECGLVFKPHTTLQTAPALDTVIIPGGKGLRTPGTNAKISAWLKSRAGAIRRIASTCTGIYGLAPTGLLDGRRVTTHWRFARDVAHRFPALEVDPDALFIKDGRFYTSAGVTAGIDLSLALIEDDYGPRVALSVARELVVYLKRLGGQEQYSEPLRFQVESADRFADLIAYIYGHLDHDLSVDLLADKVSLCPRHFSRLFKHSFGSTPASFIKTLRMDEARRRLAIPGNTIESVAGSVGFNSADAFRRVFEQRFGVPPSIYRNRFESDFKRLAGRGKGA